MSFLEPKLETFTQTYHETSNASEAFRRARPDIAKKWKPETIHKRASEMLKRGDVQGRLQQLQAQAAVDHGVTVTMLTDKLNLALNKAMAETKGASAAVSAVMGMAKLHGLLVDKAEVGAPGGGPLMPVLNVSLAPPKPRNDER